METPAFSSFRKLMTIWDEAVERDKLKSIIDGNGFVLFFKKDGDFFGAPEDSRVTFARMKSSGDGDEWNEEANFMAVNISKAIKGEEAKTVFSKEDLGKIKIVDEKDVFKGLSKEDVSPDAKTDLGTKGHDAPAPDDPPNIQKISDEL